MEGDEPPAALAGGAGGEPQLAAARARGGKPSQAAMAALLAFEGGTFLRGIGVGGGGGGAAPFSQQRATRSGFTWNRGHCGGQIGANSGAATHRTRDICPVTRVFACFCALHMYTMVLPRSFFAPTAENGVFVWRKAHFLASSRGCVPALCESAKSMTRKHTGKLNSSWN